MATGTEIIHKVSWGINEFLGWSAVRDTISNALVNACWQSLYDRDIDKYALYDDDDEVKCSIKFTEYKVTVTLYKGDEINHDEVYADETAGGSWTIDDVYDRMEENEVVTTDPDGLAQRVFERLQQKFDASVDGWTQIDIYLEEQQNG